MAEILFVLVFPVAMIAAAATDLASMTIPNRLVGALVCGFLVFAFLAGMPAAGIGLHALAALAVLLVTFGCFAAGWMGGGDAKLIAATALWFGPTPELARYALIASLFGGILTLVLLALRAALSPTTGNASLDRLLDRQTGIPYGVALGAAGLAVFAQSPLAAPLVSFVR